MKTFLAILALVGLCVESQACCPAALSYAAPAQVTILEAPCQSLAYSTSLSYGAFTVSVPVYNSLLLNPYVYSSGAFYGSRVRVERGIVVRQARFVRRANRVSAVAVNTGNVAVAVKGGARRTGNVAVAVNGGARRTVVKTGPRRTVVKTRR
jgi:hypothetical protein